MSRGGSATDVTGKGRWYQYWTRGKCGSIWTGQSRVTCPVTNYVTSWPSAENAWRSWTGGVIAPLNYMEGEIGRRNLLLCISSVNTLRSIWSLHLILQQMNGNFSVFQNSLTQTLGWNQIFQMLDWIRQCIVFKNSIFLGACRTTKTCRKFVFPSLCLFISLSFFSFLSSLLSSAFLHVLFYLSLLFLNLFILTYRSLLFLLLSFYLIPVLSLSFYFVPSFSLFSFVVILRQSDWIRQRTWKGKLKWKSQSNLSYVGGSALNKATWVTVSMSYRV
jgi:hypothetical protein